MKVSHFEIPDLLLIQPRRFGDERGWFSETWQAPRYAEAGIRETFVQDNLARSAYGVLRGLHAQQPYAQGKLVQVVEGQVFDVAVDLRLGSPAFGRWQGVVLDGVSGQQLYVPPGFAHGYCVISESALLSYKCTELYHPEAEFAVRWDDPDIGIEWPLQAAPVLSDRDASAPLLAAIPRDRLLAYA